MLLWATAGLPLGIHNILANLNVALQVQPQILTSLSLITWSQVMFYGHVGSHNLIGEELLSEKWRPVWATDKEALLRWLFPLTPTIQNWKAVKCALVLAALFVVFAGIEIAVIFGFKVRFQSSSQICWLNSSADPACPNLPMLTNTHLVSPSSAWFLWSSPGRLFDIHGCSRRPWIGSRSTSTLLWYLHSSICQGNKLGLRFLRCSWRFDESVECRWVTQSLHLSIPSRFLLTNSFLLYSDSTTTRFQERCDLWDRISLVDRHHDSRRIGF